MKLRVAARASKNGAHTRRFLALAAIYNGAARLEAAKLAGMTLQVVRDWVVRFNAEGLTASSVRPSIGKDASLARRKSPEGRSGPDGLIDRTSPGRTPILNDSQRAALAAAVESVPIPSVHGVVRWRIVDIMSLGMRHWAHGLCLMRVGISHWLRRLRVHPLANVKELISTTLKKASNQS